MQRVMVLTVRDIREALQGLDEDVIVVNHQGRMFNEVLVTGNEIMLRHAPGQESAIIEHRNTKCIQCGVYFDRKKEGAKAAYCTKECRRNSIVKMRMGTPK